ncbi:MAG: type II secretion system protein GspE, partial [Thermodesulfobacteriota bacterium]
MRKKEDTDFMRTLEEIISQKNPDAAVKLGDLLSKNGERLEETLLKSKVLTDKEVLEALSDFYGVPYVHSISEKDIDPELVKILPISFAKRFRLIPLKRGDGKVVVALAPPLD